MNIETLVTKLQYWNFLTENEKNTLIRGTTCRAYQKNEYLHGFSDACLGMIYVQKGSIRVYTISEEGREVTLFHISEGECCIMSASCVITGISLDVQFLAEEETEIMAVHSGTIQKLMDSNIYVKCYAYELATMRFSSVVWVMQEILFARFDVRMARFLLSVYETTGDTHIQMTQEAIATEVNSAREVVARMLKQFASDHFIDIKRGAIVLKNIDGLKKIIGE